MLMQSLAATGKFEAGFALLGRVDTSGLLSHSDNGCYSMFRMLGEACRFAGNSNEACRVQAAMDRLGLIALAAVTRNPNEHIKKTPQGILPH